MVFPIAVGTGPRHASSRPFPHSISRGQQDEKEQSGGSEMMQNHDEIMTMGTNDDETLTATVFISYHFLSLSTPNADSDTTERDNSNNDNESKVDFEEGGSSSNHESSNQERGEQRGPSAKSPLHTQDSDTIFNVIAELRVQIMPTTSPFVSNIDAMSSRETKSRVPLGIMRKRRSEESSSTYAPNASIEFSSNETHLACLIPLPMKYELILPSSGSCHDTSPSSSGKSSPTSTIVIFRIRANNFSSQQQLQQQKQHKLPKLPDYIVEKALEGEKTKEEIETDNAQKTERNDEFGEVASSQEEFPSLLSTSSSRGNSYVAHEPKIVRTQQPLNNGHGANNLAKENEAIPNRSFLRNLSGGKSTSSSPVQTPSLQFATCMCNVPSDHYRGKSSPSSFSLLLVGTADGTLLFVDFSLARVSSVALESETNNRIEVCKDEMRDQNQTNQRIITNGHGSYLNPIVHLSQCTPTHWKPLDIYGGEQGSESKGRIAAVVRDGSVNIYTTSFVVSPALRTNFLSDDWTENGISRSNSIDRDSGNGNNGTKNTGLEMTIDLLSTFRASSKAGCTDASLSRLRYIRAKWLNPLVLVLLTRSPCLDEDNLIRQSNNMTNVLQSDMVVAQAWTVAEVMLQNQKDQKESIEQAGGWNLPPNIGANIALVSELKMPYGDCIEELVHDTFSLSQETLRPTDFIKPSVSIFSECAHGMSIFYHQGTDCVAINSQVVTCSIDSSMKVRPFCLIWDWKRNVPGLTLASSTSYCVYNHRQDVDADILTAPSLFSWFQLGEDNDYGLCAVHVYEQTFSRKRRRACKHIFTLSTLSPLNRFAAEGRLVLNEPSAILLHRDSITFPILDRSSSTIDVSLQWEESRVPPPYVASNGSCQIAAVGKDYGRSIAIAASRGLCVLDLSRMHKLETGEPGSVSSPNPSPSQSPRWKMFSNVNDEQRFRISSMIWWECAADEDFLLAVVHYTDIDTLHLVCWSRKSLGFGESQLLKESSAHSQEANDSDAAPLGLALPPGFRVHAMSILRNPADGSSSCQSPSSNRALLLLTCVSCQEGGSSCVKYVVYQLQATQSLNEKYELVLARNSTCGRIPLQLGRSPDLSATESVTAAFLAGGSFLFDLGTEAEVGASHDAIAVIGIVTIFQGLVAVCVNQTGPILYRPSLLENSSIGDCRVGHKKSLIVAYWTSGNFSSRHGCRITWNIAQNDGKVYCWSVPCRNNESSDESIVEPNEGRCSELLPVLEKHSILGEICHLGSSSLWMNGATTSEREISLGPFCPLSFGCTLYAGQRSRKNMAMNSFHVSNCIVAPPLFTPSLFISFLSLASPRNLDLEWQLVNHAGQATSSKSLANGSYRKLARDHIRTTFRKVKSLGSSSSALRVITLKVIELLNDSKAVEKCLGSGSQGNISEENVFPLQKWKVGKSMLSEIVSIAKEMDSLGFATFFLSVGRQLEPHQFNLIFPLPLPGPDSPQLRTAEDLFSISCEHGSLATALSALPLFSSHGESRQSVTKLVYHCLIKIGENFRSCLSNTAINSGEDEAFLHQLFWFGVKLEDAIEVENSYEQGEDAYDSSSSSIVSSSTANYETANYEESSADADTDDFVSISASVESCTSDYSSDDESLEVSFLTPCRTPRKNKKFGLVKKVVKKLFTSADPSVNSFEEDAIQEAASSFIFSGFDDFPVKSPPQHAGNVASELEPANENPTDCDETSFCDVSPPCTVAGAVCLFIDHALLFCGAHVKNDMPNHGWKAVSAVANILQGDRETMAISSAGSANAQSISRILTSQDFLSAIATDNHQVADEDDCHEIIARLLVNLTADCRNQIHSQAFGTVFNLILLLLLRYDMCHDVQMCRVTLIAAGIVSGHLSGRLSELLDFSRECDANAIYQFYLLMQ